MRFLLLALGPLLACDSASSSKACTADFVSSTGHITLVDAKTGQQICEATVTATLGSQSVMLRAQAGSTGCFFAGFKDGDESAPATWTITVDAPLHMRTSAAVELTHDGCHVGNAYATIALQPTAGAGGAAAGGAGGGPVGLGGAGGTGAGGAVIGNGGSCGTEPVCAGCTQANPNSCFCGVGVCAGTCTPYGTACPTKGYLCDFGTDPTWLQVSGCAQIAAPLEKLHVSMWCCP